MDTKERKFFHFRPLFYGFLALLLAVYTSRFIFDGKLSYIFFVLIIFGAFFAYCIWAKKFIPLIVIFSIFLFGLGWYFVGLLSFQGKNYTNECQIVGRVTDDISYSKYGNVANVILKDVSIDGEKVGNISLRIYINDKNEVSSGDVISFNSKVDNVSLFSLGDFNNFYYRDNAPYSCAISVQDLTIQNADQLKWDEKFRLKMKSVLCESMGERNGAVAYAVLFGDKSSVDDDIYDSYKTAGIIHLLTVSGLHVGFLVTLLGFILRKCKVRGIYNLLICGICLGFYAYLCGFAPSILRAGIMGLVLLATKFSGKCYDNLNTLGLAGIIILLFSPLSGLDIGFLMSFFCVLGIFTVTPWLTKLFRKVFPKFIAESFAISIGAQIGILPFMATLYSSLNLLTFFINLLVIPIFSVIYPVLFLGTFAVALFPFFTFILQACGWGLSFIYNLAAFFSKTHLIIPLEPMGIFFVCAVFVMLFLLSKYFMVSKKTKKVLCSSSLALSVALCGIYYIPINSVASLSYCWNYSNEMVLLTNSQNESILIDMGYTSFTKNVLRANNVSKVKSVFLLQKNKAYIDTARSIGVENIIRCDSGEGYEEETLVNLGEVGIVGGFTFVYRAYKEKLVGLEIYFDDTKVFILKNKIHTASTFEEIGNKNYDFVVLGKKDIYSSCFSSAKNILTYYPNKNSNSNFVEDGNITFEIKGENYIRRCLD